MYQARTMTNTLLQVSQNFKVILLTGMRQVGKTTFLKEIAAGEARQYVTLDNPKDEQMAKEEPEFFFETYAPPVLIDEIQYAPDLFRYIKILADTPDKRGILWMTGSQQYNLMAGVTESLAGRVAILDMLGFSHYEQDGKATQQAPFLPSKTPPGILEN